MYLLIFFVMIIIILVPIVLVYFMLSLVPALLSTIPVCLYMSAARWWCYVTTGCWVPGMVSSTVIGYWVYWMGRPVEEFVYRLELFDENNELGFFKIFEQKTWCFCGCNNDRNSGVWWRLSTHVMQYGEKAANIYDHPSGFIGLEETTTTVTE